MDLLNHPVGIISIVLFIISYSFVMTEEVTHLRKSKPVLFVAGIIWAMIAWVGVQTGDSYAVKKELMHAFDEFNQLMLFLLVAMTYINSMTERNVFEKLRSILLNQNFSYKKLFWITGFISFFLSPIADNLTTALTMCAVVLAVGKGNKNFTSISCVNIVVAANAGGAFSPFGDITTLMVWQAGYVEFVQFFKLFLPSLVNFIIPAFIMSFFIDGSADEVENPPVLLKRGAVVISCLFLVTIMMAISFKQFLKLPPVFGMMFGLSLLQLFGYYLKRTYSAESKISRDGSDQPFGVFKQIAQAEWDTLLFFYGVILCVAGLSKIGYLALINTTLYDGLGFTVANSLMGIISALKFSIRERIINFKDYQKIINHIDSSRLTKKITKYFSKKDTKKILSFMIKDKKNNTNKINLILLKKIGSPIIDKAYEENKLQIFLKNELID